MSNIFISYSRKDETFARRLATSLQELGADIWIDVDDIPSGQKWSTAIQRGLNECELLIVVLSPDSMASINVEDEWQYFLDKKKPIIPVLLRETEIHFQLNRIQWVDFLNQTYERGLNDLHQELSKKGVEVRPPAEVTAYAAYSRSDVQAYVNSVNAEAKPSKSVASPFQLIVGIGIGAIAMMAVMLIIFVGSRTTGRTSMTQDAQVVAEATDETVSTAEPTNSPTDEPTDIPTEEPTDAPAIIPTNIARDTPTDIPTNTPTLTLTPTFTPSPTLTPVPTETPFVLSVVTRNSDWQVIERNINGVDMVLVPPGTFILGADNTQLNLNRAVCNQYLGVCSGLNDEQPIGSVTISQGFWIDKTEVTNATYNGTGNDFPKVNVNYNQATAHCSSRGTRLPTEAEWEYAAGGPDSLNYPWGNEWDSSQGLANICDSNCTENWKDSINDGFASLAPVAQFPDGASWVGALDMVGNVWEYTSTIYASYPYNASAVENPANTWSDRTLRGGAYVWIRGEATTSARATGIAPQTDFYGFRCVRDYQEGDLETFGQ